MAGEAGIVGDHHVVAERAVVADMHADHQQAMIADARLHAAAFGPGTDGDVLANGAIGADRERRRLAMVFEILRLEADRGEGKDARARPD